MASSRIASIWRSVILAPPTYAATSGADRQPASAKPAARATTATTVTRRVARRAAILRTGGMPATVSSATWPHGVGVHTRLKPQPGTHCRGCCLLQTENYARAAIRGVLPLAGDDEVGHRVQVRLRRQELLHKKSPLRLWAIVDEAAVRRLVGGPDVMAAQLRALAEISRLPHITIQVIPFVVGAHAGMPGSFVVMDFPDAADPALVYLDSMAGDLFLERDADVRRYGVTFEHLQAAALNPADSKRLVEDQAEAILKGRST
jgi:uncharacterized protein DUF5753